MELVVASDHRDRDDKNLPHNDQFQEPLLTPEGSEGGACRDFREGRNLELLCPQPCDSL